MAFGCAPHGSVVQRAAETAVDVDRLAQKLAGRVEDVVDQGFEVFFGFGREPAATLAAQLHVGKVFHIFGFLVIKRARQSIRRALISDGTMSCFVSRFAYGWCSSDCRCWL